MSESNALQRWENESAPPFSLIRDIVLARNFKRPSDKRIEYRAVQKIPLEWNERALWISEDKEWLGVSSGGTEWESWKVYCGSCAKAPEKWVSLGLGWKALQKWIDAMDKRPNLKPSQEKIKKREWSDPREIHF